MNFGYSLVSKITIAAMITCLALSLAAPVLAAGNDMPNKFQCKYGSVMVRNPHTLVITVRCVSWAEHQATRVKNAASSILGSAQSAYERGVTQPITRAGNNVAAPVVKNKEAQNAVCLLSRNTTCYGGR